VLVIEACRGVKHTFPKVLSSLPKCAVLCNPM
jgi:hypothetical protein